MQLHEVMTTRHSTMVIGPTGGGKTVVIETLCKAQTHLGKPTKLYILNPKVNDFLHLCCKIYIYIFYIYIIILKHKINQGLHRHRIIRNAGAHDARLDGRSSEQHFSRN